ncbi:hypothetical protein Nepgr_024806 [Nepenthes gracilis]|uniref:Uncharacterized protein n=1 Tax=Nepenthes gracilis TaxID=150966 RepID=A0AAD3XZ49_NEPGR|nr:hypothetical protein Nepgr_024806 [Nepenthes gracilis]
MMDFPDGSSFRRLLNQEKSMDKGGNSHPKLQPIPYNKGRTTHRNPIRESHKETPKTSFTDPPNRGKKESRTPNLPLGSKQPNTRFTLQQAERGNQRARRTWTRDSAFPPPRKPNSKQPTLTKDMVPTSKVALTTSYENRLQAKDPSTSDHPKPCIRRTKEIHPTTRQFRNRQHGLNS